MQTTSRPVVSLSELGTAALLLALLVALLHRDALNGWWRFDDALVLAYVIENPRPLDYFLSADVWRKLGVPFFMPSLPLVFWFHFNVFGHNPAAFYAHHLATIWLVAVLTFVLLRPHVGRLAAFAAPGIFLAGAPVTIVAHQLMSRHYAMGLACAIAAVVVWSRYLQNQRGRDCGPGLCRVARRDAREIHRWTWRWFA